MRRGPLRAPALLAWPPCVERMLFSLSIRRQIQVTYPNAPPSPHPHRRQTDRNGLLDPLPTVAAWLPWWRSPQQTIDPVEEFLRPILELIAKVEAEVRAGTYQPPEYHPRRPRARGSAETQAPRQGTGNLRPKPAAKSGAAGGDRDHRSPPIPAGPKRPRPPPAPPAERSPAAPAAPRPPRRRCRPPASLPRHLLRDFRPTPPAAPGPRRASKCPSKAENRPRPHFVDVGMTYRRVFELGPRRNGRFRRVRGVFPRPIPSAIMASCPGFPKGRGCLPPSVVKLSGGK